MIIGVLGQSKSGKDTLADILVDRHRMVKVALADPMKRFLHEIFQWREDVLWGPSERRNVVDERRDLTPRKALQVLGTEFGRTCYPEVWSEYLLQVYEQLQTRMYYYDQCTGLHRFCADEVDVCMDVVVPDVRFKNEVELLKRAGAFIVRVKRKKSGLTGEEAAHLSEQEQQEIPDSACDCIIYNNDELSLFVRRVKETFDYVVPKLRNTKTYPSFFLQESISLGYVSLTAGVPDFEMEMTPSVTLVDGTQVLPDQPRRMDHLSTLLEARQIDVDSGKIQETPVGCDKDQPPFKRKRT